MIVMVAHIAKVISALNCAFENGKFYVRYIFTYINKKEILML